jgi:hypothetical protein
VSAITTGKIFPIPSGYGAWATPMTILKLPTRRNQNDIKSKTQRGRTPLQALAEQDAQEGFS